VAGNADSKNEKSASAQESVLACIGASSCAFEESFSDVINDLGSSASTINAAGSTVVNVEDSLSPSSCASLPGGSPTVAGSGLVDRGTSFLSFLSGVEWTDRFAGFNIPGPIGPSSAWSGTKVLALKSADVGEMVLRNRTIGEANMVSAGSVYAELSFCKLDLLSTAGAESLGGAGSGNGSSMLGVGNVGVCTISPHSSSSSIGATAIAVAGTGGVSKLRSAQEFDTSAEGGDIGDEWLGTAVVSGNACDTVAVRLCIDCSALRGVRSTEAARPSCLCTLVTAGFFKVKGVEVERCAGLSNFHGSPDAEELQSNATALPVAKGGRLCLTGRAVFVVGMDDCVREWLKGVLVSTGAGESQ
jgi:hypothetical protein